jgi:hypothetical protein
MVEVECGISGCGFGLLCGEYVMRGCLDRLLRQPKIPGNPQSLLVKVNREQDTERTFVLLSKLTAVLC